MNQLNQLNTGIDIRPDPGKLGFIYGPGCFGPKPELRSLDDIRKSLLDPECQGPGVVYGIAMDVGKEVHRQRLSDMSLLFGIVSYASGKLGQEPVRSQGHVHIPFSPAGNWSTPEVYEIWSGRAVVYMQESVSDDPGKCYAVYAGPGEVVIVPPGWGHMAVNVDPANEMTFGAWCVREYGFEYEEVRAHNGLAWFPLLDAEDNVEWKRNPSYRVSDLVEKKPRIYDEFGIHPGIPIYTQFETNPDRFAFVPRPDLFADQWKHFIP